MEKMMNTSQDCFKELLQDFHNLLREIEKQDPELFQFLSCMREGKADDLPITLNDALEKIKKMKIPAEMTNDFFGSYVNLHRELKSSMPDEDVSLARRLLDSLVLIPDLVNPGRRT